MSRTRRLVLLALAAAGVLGLSSCSDGTGGQAAITVDGRSVSIDEFADELRTYGDARNQLAIDSLQQQAAQLGLPVEPTGTGAVSSGLSAALANRTVQRLIIEGEVEERGLEVTEEDVATARSQLESQVADPTTGEPGQITDEVLDAFAREQATVGVLGEALAAEDPAEPAEVTDEDVQAALETAEEELCASVILTAAQTDAVVARDRVQGGEDFAVVAAEVSEDASSAQGGDIGCFAASQTLPELAEALDGVPVGSVVGPVSFSTTDAAGAPTTQFLVVRLDERNEPSEADVRADLEAQAADAAAQANPLSDWFFEQLEQADVRIASRYGTWDAEQLTVVPPAGPSGGGTTDPSLAIDPATGLPVEGG